MLRVKVISITVRILALRITAVLQKNVHKHVSVSVSVSVATVSHIAQWLSGTISCHNDELLLFGYPLSSS